MEFKELALRTREEIEQELDKICPYPDDSANPGEVDHVLTERAEIRKSIRSYQIEALLDGKLTVDQVVDQVHSEDQNENLDIDRIHRGLLENALEEFKKGKDRSEIIEETFNALELL